MGSVKDNGEAACQITQGLDSQESHGFEFQSGMGSHCSVL